MPKTKRNIKLATPKAAPVAPAQAVIAAPTAAAPSKAAERAVNRDARYLETARYSTDTVTGLSASYIPLFAAAAKRGNGTFRTSDFDPAAASNPESPKRNFRARANLLAQHGILHRETENLFRFTAAVAGRDTPTNAPSHILAARTAYANAKA